MEQIMKTDYKYGINGYPEMTPNGVWLACAVFRGNEFAYHDIYPSHNNLLFKFRDKVNSHWLPPELIKAINASHTKECRHRKSVMKHHDFQYWESIFQAEVQALSKEKVFKKKYEDPTTPFELNEGGWLPTNVNFAGSQVAWLLSERQKSKLEKDYKTSDIIRKEVESGQVEVRDEKDGVMWFFGV